MNSSSKPVIIIGAGVGGLSTATLLVNDGYYVSVYEKSDRVGGRTASMEFKNHILDNGFHIMPFYKKSAIYEILKDVKIESRLKLAIVDKIAFYDNGFHTYPKGITDILKMSLIPFKSRISLLKILLPMAFTSMKKAEKLDSVPLTQVTSKLDFHSRQFLMLFVCLHLQILLITYLLVNLQEPLFVQIPSKEEQVNLHIPTWADMTELVR